jgi:hypothetical protein
MKYLKSYEKHLSNFKVLYRCPKFGIIYNNNDSFSYVSTMTEKSAIFAMTDLIENKSMYLNDDKLRNIKLRKKDIEFETEQLDNLYNQKIENYKFFRSSNINHFIDDKKIIKNMSENAYINITFKLYPIISKAIKESKTIGDIIDKFKIISDEINKNLPLYIDISIYNI